MGTATNQIATEKDLYYSGFTNFASSGASGALGVTYEDLLKIKDAGFVQSVPSAPIHLILSNIHYPAYNESVAFNVFPQTYTNSMVISQWDVGPLSNLDSVTLYDTRCGMFLISVTNSGAASAKVFLYLTFDNSTFTAGTTTSTTNVKYVSTTSVPMGQTVTINSCMHSVLGQNATTVFKGKKTCQWVIVCTNTAPLSGGTYTTLTVKQDINDSVYGSLGWIDSKKLVKYSLIGGKDKPVKVPWTIKISENVTSSTKANVIEFIYMMMYTNGDNTARFEEISLGTFTLNDGNNISGSAEATVYIDINPHSIKKDSVNLSKPMYGAWLIVKCGETSGKLTWTRKLRTASTSSGNTGTWESSFSDTNLSGDSWIGSGANSAKTAYMKIGEGYSKAMDAIGALNPPTYTDEQFLKDVKKYNGIEFNIK